MQYPNPNNHRNINLLEILHFQPKLQLIYIDKGIV